jgi:hypothetical protein
MRRRVETSDGITSGSGLEAIGQVKLQGRDSMNSTHTEKPGRKQKIIHELRQLMGIFLYLGVFFIVLRTYTHLILAEYEIIYAAYALTLLKALALAKIIITGETLRLGARRFHDRPLIITTLYNTVVFSIFALVFEVVEHFIYGWIRGKGFTEVYTEILDKGWPHLVAATLVVFVAFLPFFAFREMERVLGEGKLKEWFFKRPPGDGERLESKGSQVPEPAK